MCSRRAALLWEGCVVRDATYLLHVEVSLSVPCYKVFLSDAEKAEAHRLRSMMNALKVKYG